MIGRRAFLGAVATGSAVAALVADRARTADGPAGSTRERPWVVRVEHLHDGAVTNRSTVLDARTGEDVSDRFPIGLVPRVDRSLRGRRPVRVALFRLDARGKHFVQDGRLATEGAWILAVS